MAQEFRPQVSLENPLIEVQPQLEVSVEAGDTLSAANEVSLDTSPHIKPSVEVASGDIAEVDRGRRSPMSAYPGRFLGAAATFLVAFGAQTTVATGTLASGMKVSIPKVDPNAGPPSDADLYRFAVKEGSVFKKCNDLSRRNEAAMTPGVPGGNSDNTSKLITGKRVPLAGNTIQDYTYKLSRHARYCATIVKLNDGTEIFGEVPTFRTKRAGHYRTPNSADPKAVGGIVFVAKPLR